MGGGTPAESFHYTRSFKSGFVKRLSLPETGRKPAGQPRRDSLAGFAGSADTEAHSLH